MPIYSRGQIWSKILPLNSTHLDFADFHYEISGNWINIFNSCYTEFLSCIVTVVGCRADQKKLLLTQSHICIEQYDANVTDGQR